MNTISPKLVPNFIKPLQAEAYSKALEQWIRKNPNVSVNDKMAAEQMLRDLQNSLKGK